MILEFGAGTEVRKELTNARARAGAGRGASHGCLLLVMLS